MVKHRKYKMETALAELSSDISSGKYKPGSFLPAERTLAEMLDVSRGTLRSILKELQKKGVIRINPGKGAYVIDASERKGLKRFIVKFSSINPHNRASEAVGALLGICAAASKIHAEAVISFGESSKDVSEIISRFASDDIQGAVFFECSDYKNVIAPLEKAGVPYVVANLEHDIPAVAARMNYREVGRAAGKFLIGAGHRKIGALAGPLGLDRFIYREMLAGFRGALAEEEIVLDKDWVAEMESESEEARRKSIQLLKKPDLPTAFFAMRDIRACGFYTACRELGLNIPNDISIVSYDNITWPSAEQAGLSTIEESVEQMGEAAVEMLAEWITTGRKPQNREFAGELVERSSCIRI